MGEGGIELLPVKSHFWDAAQGGSKDYFRQSRPRYLAGLGQLDACAMHTYRQTDVLMHTISMTTLSSVNNVTLPRPPAPEYISSPSPEREGSVRTEHKKPPATKMVVVAFDAWGGETTC